MEIRNLETGSFVAEGYQVQNKLGSGYRASCYEVTDTTCDKPYCFKITQSPIEDISTTPREVNNNKILDQQEADPEKHLAESLRFQLEIHFLKELMTTQGVPNIYNWGNVSQKRKPGEPKEEPSPPQHGFLICDLMPGETIHDLVTFYREEFTYQEVLKVAFQVAKILEQAHAKNILHRDIKPKNLLWDPETQRTSLVDWGMSAYLNPETKKILYPEKDGVILGTLRLLAPEQADGLNEEVGIATDIFNLGGTIYTMLTQRYLYQGEDEWETIGAAMIANFRPLDDSFPEGIRDLVHKALAFSPTDRFSSAKEFATAIREVAEKEEKS